LPRLAFKHEPGCAPAHRHQHVGETVADFQLARLDTGSRVPGKNLHIHPLLLLHFLREAEAAEVLVTRNLGYQQNLKGRKIAIIVLGPGRWSLIRHCVPRAVATVNAAIPGSFTEVDIPFE
jgi:hypothetical protein